MLGAARPRARDGPRRSASGRGTPGIGATGRGGAAAVRSGVRSWRSRAASRARSEEHTSELQSRQYLVCRLLLEKKKKKKDVVNKKYKQKRCIEHKRDKARQRLIDSHINHKKAA